MGTCRSFSIWRNIMRDTESKQEIVRDVNTLKDIRAAIAEVNMNNPAAIISVKLDIVEEKTDGKHTV